MNPYEPEVDWFTREPEIHSLHQGPEPKRRFMPSKWEEKKCAPTPFPPALHVGLSPCGGHKVSPLPAWLQVTHRPS